MNNTTEIKSMCQLEGRLNDYCTELGKHKCKYEDSLVLREFIRYSEIPFNLLKAAILASSSSDSKNWLHTSFTAKNGKSSISYTYHIPINSIKSQVSACAVYCTTVDVIQTIRNEKKANRQLKKYRIKQKSEEKM